MESSRQLKAANTRKILLDHESIDATNREKDLDAQVESLKEILIKRRSLIQEVKGISRHSFILWPSKFSEDVAKEMEESDFCWMPCAVCEGPFPNKDVILAPYMCLYHPWCVVMQN
jgi:hypothetical protein